MLSRGGEMRMYVPSRGVEDWRRLLEDPKKQWKRGHSARALAYCWEKASAFPPEIIHLFTESGVAAFAEVELLIAIPEHVVPLRGTGKGSQNDVFVLGKGADGGLISMTIEGKVAEPFDVQMDKWTLGMSSNKQVRLQYLTDMLGLSGEIPDEIWYQLLHRTASAVIEAKRFNARYAAMVVHSFSQEDVGLGDYSAFVKLFGAEAGVAELVYLNDTNGIQLYSGWARGDARYLES